MGRLVPIRLTPWATPAPDLKHAHRHEVCVNMDSILRVAGIEEDFVRRRLTAHAIVACGWPQQNCYNFNAWKCKIGHGWEGDYYVHDTKEHKKGEYVIEPATWRSYPSYVAALEDHRVWHLARYKDAKAALIDGSRPDRDYCQALRDGGYFNDPRGVDMMAGVCARVKRELEAASPAEMAAADEATAIAANLEAGADDTRPFPLLAVCAACAVGIGVVLCGIGVARMMRGRK